MKTFLAFLRMIKFEHSIFALPFAYLGYVLGAKGNVIWIEVFWITVVMICARTIGMTLNRLIDLRYDSKNPRTARRELVTGEIGKFLAIAVVVFLFIALAYSVMQLHPMCIKLFPAAVMLLVVYHFLKRFTSLCHFGIGLVLACAPVGGWVAASGSIELGAMCLGIAVLFWVAGFDIFYSLQDLEFDRLEGLHSLPAQLGPDQAVRVAMLCHFLTLFFLIQLGVMLALNPLYWVGLIIAGAILLQEHRLIRLDRKKYVNHAFFSLNGLLSIAFFVVTFFSQAR